MGGGDGGPAFGFTDQRTPPPLPLERRHDMRPLFTQVGGRVCDGGCGDGGAPP